MLPHNQSNTIDFDAAKLQRLGRTRPQLKPLSLAQLRQHLNLLLQTTLEASRLFELFFHEVQRLVPLNALNYQLASSDLHLELGEPANHAASYNLSHAGEYLGELTFRRNQRFSDEELGQLESLLGSLLFPLRNALLYRSAVQGALRDPLTATGNRIAMNQALQHEIELAQRTLQPLSALMLDIDHFKHINDRFGHAVGDEVLKAVAASLKGSLRNIDMVFRYGGEEFLILLTNTDREAAQMVGERLRLAVLGLQYLQEGQALELTISLGCATLLPGESADSLQRRADNALYVSKRGGRNRLSMAG